MPEQNEPAAADPMRPAFEQRPDWVTDQYWDDHTSTVDLKAVYDDTTALKKRWQDGLEAHRARAGAEVAAEIEAEQAAERRKGVPDAPEGYVLPGPIVAEQFVVIDKRPDDNFRPEEGKLYFQLKADDPMLAAWRAVAHRTGLSQEAFVDGIRRYVQAEVDALPTVREVAERETAFFDGLGENGRARFTHLFGSLSGRVGADGAAALMEMAKSVEMVQALERLLVDGRGASFASTDGRTANPPLTAEDLRKLMATPKYWRDRDPDTLRRVEDGFRNLYPEKSNRGGRRWG